MLEDIIRFEVFDESMCIIKDAVDTDIKLANLLGADIVELGIKPANMIISLLEEVCKDEDGWISWYCWDTDFGKKKLSWYHESCPKPRYVRNNKALYKILCDNYKNKE